MSSEALFIASFAIVVLLVYQLYFIYRNKKSIEKYSHLRRIEETEALFARARNELMEQAVMGKINTKSLTFRYLYHLNTSFMRRPDKYENISKNLFIHFMGSELKEDHTIFDNEMESWTEDTRKIFQMTSEAIGNIVIEFSKPMKFLLQLFRIFDPNFSHIDLLQNLISSREDRNKFQAQQEIKTVQEELYNLSQKRVSFVH